MGRARAPLRPPPSGLTSIRRGRRGGRLRSAAGVTSRGDHHSHRRRRRPPGRERVFQRDYKSSGRGGGSYPLTTATQAYGGRVAAAAGLPAAGDADACTSWLDDVDLGSGPASMRSTLVLNNWVRAS